MSSEVVRELFRNFEKYVHERLSVIEDILTSTKQTATQGDVKAFDPSPLLERLTELEGHFRSLDEYTMGQIRTLAFNHDQLETRVEALETSTRDHLKQVVTLIESLEKMQKRMDDEKPVEAAEVEAEMEETQEAALNAEEESLSDETTAKAVLVKAVEKLEEEEEDVEEEEEEEEEEVEAEEEELDLEIFTYKKKDWCRDQNNNVYPVDEAGEADISEVVGIWNPTTKKIDPVPQEEEELTLESFEYQKKTYCRDQNNNVYPMDDDGCADISEIIGTWNPKTKKIDRVPNA
jgi:hypothetical protein